MKTAIITGASRGVGRAAAEALAEDGWRLILNCRSRFELLEQEAERLRCRTEVKTVHGPITEAVLEKLLASGETSFRDFTEAHMPAGDDMRSSEENESEDALLLVNNAGISTFHLVQDVSDQELSEMLEVNVSDMFRLTRAAIPHMLRSSGGRIINVSSVWGVTGASMESVYSLTKGAVNAFTAALGKELAPNHIPVNAVALGCVDTDMNGWMSAADRAQLEEEIPYGRMCTPEEAASLIRLLSKAPAYLTGQVIRFDGGWI